MEQRLGGGRRFEIGYRWENNDTRAERNLYRRSTYVNSLWDPFKAGCQ